LRLINKKTPNCLLTGTEVLIRLLNVNSSQFKRWLAIHGCKFSPANGGHLKVWLEGHFSCLPMHGGGKELGKGLMEKIKKDLGLN
jgi:mRNA interferase HicA